MSFRLSEEQYAALTKRKAKPLVKAPTVKSEGPDKWPAVLQSQIIEAGLPAPFREFTWHPTRNFRADLAWPGHQFAVEVDGAVHRIKGKFERDIERHNLLVLAGWKYLRVTPDMVRSGEALRLVREALAATPANDSSRARFETKMKG